MYDDQGYSEQASSYLSRSDTPGQYTSQSDPHSFSSLLPSLHRTGNPASSLSKLTLNSSGSSECPSPPDLEKTPPDLQQAPIDLQMTSRDILSTLTPFNTPIDNEDTDDDEDSTGSSPILKIPTASQLNDALFKTKEAVLLEGDLDFPLGVGKEAHNAKERARRSRIKIACEQLRSILPGITLKTDKATVFEFAVQYITYLRSLVGQRHQRVDMEFLKQCSPY